MQNVNIEDLLSRYGSLTYYKNSQEVKASLEFPNGYLVSVKANTLDDAFIKLHTECKIYQEIETLKQSYLVSAFTGQMNIKTEEANNIVILNKEQLMLFLQSFYADSVRIRNSVENYPDDY